MSATRTNTEIKIRLDGLNLKDGTKYVTLSAEPDVWRDILNILDSYDSFGPELRSYTTIFPEQAQTSKKLLEKLVDHQGETLIAPINDFNAIQALVREYRDFGYGHHQREDNLNIDLERYTDIALQCEEAARNVKMEASAP